MIVATSFLAFATSAFATTKGLSQIVTPDLQPEGDLSLSLQIQDERIAYPYELQAELGLTKWAKAAVFKAFKPDDYILANMTAGAAFPSKRAGFFRVVKKTQCLLCVVADSFRNSPERV